MYGVEKALSQEMYQKLLNHFLSVFVSEKGAAGRRDNQGTLSFLLCGRMRSQLDVEYNGQTMTCLNRAIHREHEEYTTVMQEFAEGSDSELEELYGLEWT